MILVVFLYMLIASTFTIAKLVLQYVQPIFFISARMLIAGSLLLGYLYFFNRSKLVFKRKHFWDFVSITLFHVFFSFVAEFWALQYLRSSTACLFYNLSPFISAVFSYFWFTERMTSKKFVGLLLGLSGFLPVIIYNSNSGTRSGLFGFFSLAELAMLLSVVSASYGWIVMRKLAKNGYSVIAVNGIGMIGGGILALVTSFIFEGWWPKFNFITNSPATDILKCVGYGLLLIILANVVFYNLYGFLLRKYTATFLSFAGFMTPLFAALYGWFFLGESVGVSFFFTIFLVFAGLYIFYQEELRQGYILNSK